MAIPKHVKANYETLLRAARAKDLAVMECKRKADGQIVYVLTALRRDSGTVHMTPLAVMCDGNPYEDYLPPDPDTPGGFVNPEGE
jgi:hypothetical protein